MDKNGIPPVLHSPHYSCGVWEVFSDDPSVRSLGFRYEHTANLIFYRVDSNTVYVFKNRFGEYGHVTRNEFNEYFDQAMQHNLDLSAKRKV